MEKLFAGEDPIVPFCGLPTEIFLHICSFLSTRDLVLGLSRVCKRFDVILNDEKIWKRLILKRWKLKYPIVSVDADRIHWQKACFDIEREWNLWKFKEENVKYSVINGVHMAAVDAIVFINKSTCISGSRDRSMVIWNPKKKIGKFSNYVQKDAVHQGWIWRLHYDKGRLYSCSWDNTIKVWTLDDGDMILNSTFKCAAPVLSLALIDGLVVSGDFGKTVSAFDPRCKEGPVFTYGVHQRPVLTLGSTDKEVISGSEDKTLAIWDTRKRNIVQTISFGKRFPNSISIEDRFVYVGDSKGSLRIFNSQNGNLKSMVAFNMGHKKPISVIKHDLGYLVTGSLDGTVKISLPTRPPRVLSTIKTIRGEVGGLDYHDGILAVGASNFVEFWFPKDHIKY